MANEFKIKNGFFSEGSSNITGSLNVSAGITGSLFGTASWANNATTSSFVTTAQTASYVLQAVSASFAISSSRAISASFATQATNAYTASNITPVITNDGDTRVITANGNGTLNGEGSLTFDGTTLRTTGTISGSILYSTGNVSAAVNLQSLFSSGDEGGEIFLNKPVTGTSINTGVNIDVYQNKLRIWEAGGTNRGGYYDITALAASVGTNLLGGSGTVTQVNTAGTVNGITLTGGPITGAGTVTLGGTLSGIGNTQLTNSSITIGSTNIALGATSTTLAGLTSVTSTNFTGTASYATQALSSSYAITASYVLNAVTASYALTASNSQNAQDILIYVKNVTGAQINKGKVVRISGATGDNALISTASYESDGVSANTLGITNQDIPHDSFGYVITEGTLIGINTNAFSAGQLLYLGATGSIIGTAPVAPLHAVRLGQVLRVQINNGSMYVRIDNGYELGELHDVVDSTTTSSFGDLLVKSGSVWINSKQLTGSYGLTGSLNATSLTGSLLGTASYATQALSSSYAVTASYALTAGSTAAVAGTTNYVPKFATATTLGNSQIFDNGTNVGIGTTSPAAKVHISGNGAVQRLESNGTYTALDFYNTTAAANSRNWSIGSNLYNYGDFNIMNSVSSGSAPTSANTYLTINKDGLVGIGTTSPVVKLQVDGTISSTGVLTAYTSVPSINIGHDGSSAFIAATSGGGANSPIYFSVGNNAEKMRITTAGNVGIGTTNPNSKLEIVGNTSISGSLITSGSTGDGINTSTLELLTSGVASIDWGNKELYDTNNTVTVDWEQMILSSPQGGGVTTVYWGANLLKSLNTSMSIDWDNRIAYDSAGTSSIDWGTRALNDSFAFTSLDWENKALYDSTGVGSMDWNSRTAYDGTNVTSVEWGSRILYDSAGASSVNWEDRFLLSATSAVKIFDWSSDYWLFSPSYQKDVKSLDLQDTVSGLGASDDTYLGDIIDGRVDGINYPSNGQVVYLETDGFWYAYDQTDTNIYGKMVGLVFKVDSGAQTCKVLLEGHVLIDNIIGPGVQSVDHGLPVYIKYLTTTGEMGTGSPSGGIVQVLGHCYYQNTTTSHYWMMKFRPSNDWYETT
jgi:hypothetical protein